MTTRAKNQATAAGAVVATPQAGVIVDEQVLNPQEEQAIDAETLDVQDDGLSWDSIMDGVEAAKTREDIIRECLADSKHFRRINGLHVKNVKAVVYKAKDTNNPTTRITFVVKETVPGMVKDTLNLDAFGQPTSKLGPTNNIFSSAYAVSGAMKETAKGALFADDVSRLTAPLGTKQEVEIDGVDNIVNQLYAGGTVDVICQIVPANTEYRNPFSSNVDVVTTFPENRIFHHVVNLTFGEVGEDTYRARLAK